MTGRSGTPMAWAVVCALVVNCLIVFLLIPGLSKRIKPLYNQNGFQDGYDLIAENLATGNGYRFYPNTAPTLMREPGYPVLLAGLRRVFGPAFTAVKVANVCLAAFTALIMLLLARRILGDGPWVLVSPLLFLFHPGTILAESRGGVEIISGALLALFMVLVYRAIETRRWWSYALAGAALGAAVLVRSTPILFPVFLLAYLLIFERPKNPARATFSHIACLIAAMAVLLSPWVIRNYRLTGRIVPTASVLGVSAQAGQYICTHLSLDRQWWELDRAASRERDRLAAEAGYRFTGPYYQTFYTAADEMSFSDYLLHRVVRTYENDPGLCLKCMAYNVVNFWCAGKTWSATALSAGVQIPYLLLAAIGVAVEIRKGRGRRIGPLLLIVAYSVAVCVPILAQARYSVMLNPFVSLLAGLGLCGMYRMWTRRPPAIGLGAAPAKAAENVKAQR